MKVDIIFLLLWLIITSLPGQGIQQTAQVRDITALIYEGEIERALFSLDSLAVLDSTDASLYYLKCHAYTQLGDNSNALKAYHHAAELDSTHINALAAAGKLYDQSGYYDRAQYYLIRAIW